MTDYRKTLIELYQKRGLGEEAARKAGEAFDGYSAFLSESGRDFEVSGLSDMEAYLAHLIKGGQNSLEALYALARVNYLAGKNKVYQLFTSILERENVIDNLRVHMGITLGEENTEQLFADIQRPESGAMPEEALGFAEELTGKLDGESSQTQNKALTANAHGIPRGAFDKEKEAFQAAVSLEEYLIGTHERAVATLQEHADSGKIWFEQIITQDVVDWVRENQQVLGGELKEGRIFLTKIPFDPDGWLKSRDKEKKRYLYCHCPLAREALNPERTKSIDIKPFWCRCSGGFSKQKFDTIFETETEVEVLESVLSGGDFCRFAITVPEKFI